jgi:glutamine cyclotransferase
MKPLAIVGLVIIIAAIIAGVFVLVNQSKRPESEVTTYAYSVVNVFPHDSNAFTEGLIYADGFFYESTGLNGQSSLREVNLTTGIMQRQLNLSSEYFGEGIALVGNKIIQLTYKNQIGFIYDKTTFQPLGNFSYTGEGWALTYNGDSLIMSNGSDTLTFLNPQTLQPTGQIQVHQGNIKIENLNELEYVKGRIYANIFEEKKIAIINPQTGQVTDWIDLSGLAARENADSWSVLNGIAYDAVNNRLFVTGKDWAHIYEITIVPNIPPVAANVD